MKKHHQVGKRKGQPAYRTASSFRAKKNIIAKKTFRPGSFGNR